MLISVVACGSSAEGWHKVPCDLSIGINDAYKFGHKFNILGVWNHPNKFPKDRLATILKTRPIKLYTCYDAWWNYFDDMVLTKTRSYDGILRCDCDRLTSANTSPIIAMSLAHCLGANKIILWGVSFIDHSTFNKSNPQTKIEIRQYIGYINLLRASGIDVFIGQGPSALDPFIPKYEHKNIL